MNERGANPTRPATDRGRSIPKKWLPLIALMVVVPLGTVPVAKAHCDPGTSGELAPGLSTCPANEPLEETIDALNAASDGTVVHVLVKDLRFHPEVVHVKSGGTVVLVYADTDRNEQHHVVSSGQCADSGVDPVEDPKACDPSVPGLCFDNARDQGQFMKALGDEYPVTFRYATADQVVEKSHGYLSGTLVGDLTGAQNFRECPDGTADTEPDRAVVPYHCRIHTDIGMRGTIVVEAA